MLEISHDGGIYPKNEFHLGWGLYKDDKVLLCTSVARIVDSYWVGEKCFNVYPEGTIEMLGFEVVNFFPTNNK